MTKFLLAALLFAFTLTAQDFRFGKELFISFLDMKMDKELEKIVLKKV